MLKPDNFGGKIEAKKKKKTVRIESRTIVIDVAKICQIGRAHV